ncbi:hypothetical protein [Escherichia phage phiWec190]|uniref:hypothetical protein n=1 Tax=Escherichia coli TaxID=562 RepID=UPI001FF5CCB4|nr:hypothetical protein [Escherichia coli]MCJ8478790.1 hypothetical protein [Escherichia coli]BDU13275.1 hypothetical protein [Escherichia phage phiWec188]BDU13628.1 hypothetical protein [Escherichia phage phiWec190]
METTYWDGKTPLDVGHIALVYGASAYDPDYPSIEEGQEVTILAKDRQPSRDVFIVRWYDEGGYIRVSPLVPHCLHPVSKNTKRAQDFVNMFDYLHSIRLNPKDVQKVFDKLQEVEQDVSQDEAIEVNLWGNAGLDLLVGKTPLTLKLWSSDYKIDDDQIGINVGVLAVATNSKVTPQQAQSFYWFDMPVQASF